MYFLFKKVVDSFRQTLNIMVIYSVVLINFHLFELKL